MNYSFFLKCFVVFICASLICCNKKIQNNFEQQKDVFSSAITKSSDSCFYYEPLGCYLSINQDPYKLESINCRLSSLSNLNIVSSGSTNKQSLFSNRQPSHRAFKVLPKSYQEYEQFVKDSSLMVSSIPFGCSIFHPAVSAQNDSNAILADEPNDESRPCCEETAPAGGSHFKSYPLYITLPYNQPIPEGAEFLYDVYIPSDSTDTDILLSASIAGLIDDSTQLRPIDIKNLKEQLRQVWSGVISSYDEVLGQYVPIKNAEVILVVGAATTTTHTDSYGCLSFPLSFPSYTKLALGLWNSTFTVNYDSTACYHQIGTLQSFRDSPTSYTFTADLPYSFVYQVYNAARYYFYSSNSLISLVNTIDEVISTPFVINALPHDGGKAGVFRMGATPPYINVWEYYLNGTYRASYNTCTVFHELGHATHYATVGYSSMASADNYVRESFASFFSWYCMQDYYSSILNNTVGINDICHQGRQSWTLSSNSTYTPFYVDLYDAYNQHSSDTSKVDDNISYIPLTYVKSSALGKNSLQASYNYLKNYSSYYTPSDLNTIAGYYGGLINTY